MKSKSRLPSWLRSKQLGPEVNVGVGWYDEEEWSKVKAVAADPELFEETYAEWERMAEDTLRQLRKKGLNPKKSYVKAEELVAWCLAHRKRIDGTARAQFVAEQEERQSRESGGT